MKSSTLFQRLGNEHVVLQYGISFPPNRSKFYPMIVRLLQDGFLYKLDSAPFIGSLGTSLTHHFRPTEEGRARYDRLANILIKANQKEQL